MVYTFLTFDLDEERLELRDSGSPVAVEPRVLEFLLHLVRCRGRVVTKAELATEVWGARIVSDASLARCASDARHLLGDVERPHRIIETVYGRGYRFVAPVNERPASSAAGESGEAPVLPPAGSRWLRVGGGFLLAAVSAFVVGWVLERGTRSEPKPPAAIAITWSASDEDPELRWVGLSLADLIGHTLSADPRLSLVGPPFFQEDDSDSALAARGRSLGARQLLHLSVATAPITGNAELEARWFDDLSLAPPVPRPLLRDVVPIPRNSQGALDRYLETRKSLVSMLESRLEVTLSDDQGSTLEPRDAEAWRLYLGAMVDWEVGCSDREKAAVLERSLELDPRFAPAWYALAAVRLTRANLCGSDGSSYERAREAAERAVKLAPTWPDPHQLLAAMELYRNGTEQAHALLLRARERFPHNFHVWLRSAEALRYAGFLDRSLEAYERALSLWPAAMALTDSVPYPYLYLGEWERFLESLSGRDSPYFRYYRGWAEWQSGRPELARAALEPAFRESPGDLFARLAQALLAILDEREDEAAVVLEQLVRQRQGNSTNDGEVTYKIAQLLVLAGKPDLGLEQLDLAVGQGFFCPRCMVRDPAFAALRSEERFLAALDRARRRHRAFADRFGIRTELAERALLPMPEDRLTAIAESLLSAWNHADLVCLGETHGSLTDAALRTALVEHPEFPDTVDVIVLESASSVHQELLDRFVLEGEKLSRRDLQPVWRDAGRGVFWELPIYEEFLRTVRRVNLTVPRRERVRLIGGAVPIPWQEVTTAEDLLPWIDREAHLRRWIRSEVLDRGLKGLAIFGSFHCEKRGASFAAALQAETPGRVFSAFAFSGEEGVREGRTRLGLGAEPGLVPVAGTPRANQPAGASFFEGHAWSGALFGEFLDAVVYYGTAPDVVRSVDEDALDPAFRREVRRRDRLRREAARLAEGIAVHGL